MEIILSFLTAGLFGYCAVMLFRLWSRLGKLSAAALEYYQKVTNELSLDSDRSNDH